MKNWLRGLFCLLMLYLAACTAVPAAAPVSGEAEITRTNIVVTPVLPVTSATLAPTPSPLPSETDTPLPAPTPMLSQPQAGDGPTATPVFAAASYRKPWQYFSGAYQVPRLLMYRLRYPIGWHALRGEDGSAVLQNYPPGQGDDLLGGRIRLEIGAAFSAEPGGFAAPNQKTLAAGRPGTRQVLVDSTRELTIWNVRLYGLGESSAVFQLTGYLSGSTAQTVEGARLLDEILATLQLYAWPEPEPAPVVPDYSLSDSWQQYAGRISDGDDSYELRFRVPPGWWPYPDGDRWVDVINFFGAANSSSTANGVGASSAGAPPLAPGAVRLSISAEPCADTGGCPFRPGWLSNNMPGSREISRSDNGDTLWLVHLYQGETRFTLSAILSGSEEQVQGGILALNMLLRTVQVFP